MSILSLAKRGLMTFWYPYVKTLNTMWPSITVGGSG